MQGLPTKDMLEGFIGSQEKYTQVRTVGVVDTQPMEKVAHFCERDPIHVGRNIRLMCQITLREKPDDHRERYHL